MKLTIISITNVIYMYMEEHLHVNETIVNYFHPHF